MSARPVSPGLESYLGADPTPVLDHGFVRVVDYMGADDSVVQAARVSHGRGTDTPDKDRALIHYLMRHEHTTPFEMAEIKFHVKLPIFVARQWIRHRTANVNEYSMRYSEAPTEVYIPESQHLMRQSATNKQGRAEPLSVDEAHMIQLLLRTDAEQSQGTYKLARQAYDLSRELARIGLGLNTYTEWYWKTDLHNLFNFLRLRLHKSAQYEIRVYAEAIDRMVEAWVPVCHEAFVLHQLGAFKLSVPVLDVLRDLLADRSHTATGWHPEGLSTRDRAELFEALGWPT